MPGVRTKKDSGCGVVCCLLFLNRLAGTRLRPYHEIVVLSVVGQVKTVLATAIEATGTTQNLTDQAMKSTTLTIDENMYAKAERKASALQTSVGEVVAEYLHQWAAEDASLESARRDMNALFTQPNWQFAVGTPDEREQRNARS